MGGGHGAFYAFVLKHFGHEPVMNRWTSTVQVPVSTPVSDALSKDLKKAGFSFVGTTIVYAYMQAIGMVNDHLLGCWRRNV